MNNIGLISEGHESGSSMLNFLLVDHPSLSLRTGLGSQAITDRPYNEGGMAGEFAGVVLLRGQVIVQPSLRITKKPANLLMFIPGHNPPWQAFKRG